MFQDEPAEVKLKQAHRISDLKNLGPSSELAFHKAGIKSAKQFQKLGWKAALKKLIKSNPKNTHSIFAYALIGALETIEWNRISAEQKKEAQLFCKSLREKAKKKSSIT